MERLVMDDSSLLILLLFALVVVVSIVVVLAFLAAGLTLIFTDFVMKLPLLISVIMFIIFPPTLIVFLVGYGMIYFGLAERMYGVTKNDLKK
jgi:hypothetical protein